MHQGASLSELPEDSLLRYKAIREDAWLFLKYCVLTMDEIDLDNPIKPFPSHLKYLKFLAFKWKDTKKLAIPKSRRMTVSWTFIGLAVWDVLFHKGRSWAFVSKKEEDSKELVQRAEFIINNIPKDIIAPELLPKMNRGEMQTAPPAIVFNDIQSKIQGFPQGANQLRQRGFSGILQDECAFWEDAEEAYASAEPTISAGGRMVMISSRSVEDRGFFKKIVFDKLNAPDTRFPEVPPAPFSSPMEGITVWKNPENGFTVVELHYTADPAKRGHGFRETLRKKLPLRKFLMEYEKSWETYEGRPVFQDFNPLLHLTHTEPEIQVGLPLLLGWDSSGLTPAVVVGQLQGDRLFLVKEFVEQGKGAVTFVPYISTQLKLMFPQIPDLEHTISFIDPAGNKKAETNEQTYHQYIMKTGFRNVRLGAVSFEKRREAVDEYLVSLVGGKTKIVIYEQGCPILAAGFKGGYRFPDDINLNEPDKIRPIKDIHSHVQDALQYLLSGLKSFKQSHYFEVPTPSYGFQRRMHVNNNR